MASDFFNYSMALGKTTEGMTMKFLPGIGIRRETQNKKKLTYLAWSVNHRPKSRKPDFWKCSNAKFCRIFEIFRRYGLRCIEFVLSAAMKKPFTTHHST